MKKGWWEEESLADVRKGMRCAKLGNDWVEVDLERYKADQEIIKAAFEWRKICNQPIANQLLENEAGHKLVKAIENHPGYKDQNEH